MNLIHGFVCFCGRIVQILVDVKNISRVVTLNSPRVLNTLNGKLI
jgi:hypothetical protein